MTTFIIAIDGPAASGKGTLARKIAETLNFAHMDTGALYRAVGWEMMQGADDPVQAAQTLRAKIESAPSADDILGNPQLRNDEVGQQASKVAAIPAVRACLLQLQKDFAQNPAKPFEGAVLDGRDIGTVVCPDADVKLFVTASAEIRAQRRTKELQSRGIAATYEAVLNDMTERDARDAARDAAPMIKASDAIEINTNDLDQIQALDKALENIRQNMPV